MLNVPKKANDAMHLSLLEGYDENLDKLGEVILQDTFQVWDSKQIIRKGRERHIFLFELSLLFSKEVKDANGKAKYLYKSQLLVRTMTSELGITEHIEGDECKFGLWTGRAPISDYKIILKASSLETKQLWVKKLREVIQETYFSSALPLNLPKSPAKGSNKSISNRSSRDLDDSTSLEEGSIEHQERGSVASFGSSNTTDSDKGLSEVVVVCEDHAASPGSQELSVQRGQQVEVVEAGPDWCLVRVVPHACNNSNSDPVGGVTGPAEGLVPASCLKPLPNMRTSVSKSSMDNDGQDSSVVSGDVSAGPSANNNNTSPANKRRSTFRKWLTNPVRKLSHGRLDKAALETTKANAKKGNTSTRWKLLSSNEEMGNKPLSPSPPSQPDEAGDGKAKPCKEVRSQSLDFNGEEEDGGDIELPPPMQIQERTFPAVTSQDDAQMKREQQAEVAEQQQRDPPEATDLSPSETDDYPPVSNQEPTPPEDGADLAAGDNDASSQDVMQSPDDALDDNVHSQALIKRRFVVQELVDTEADYVRDLGTIIEGYMELMKDKDGEIPMPEDLRSGKDKMIFGNIEQIYEWHRDTFLNELQNVVEDPARLGPLFRRYERKLNMYVVYCQNKPKSEFIVSEYADNYFEELRQKLGHKLQLPDLLIKPVQRIMKYQLLIKDILRFTEKAGLPEEAESLRQAVRIMHVVPKAANDMMNVGRLQGFEGKITAQGKLLLQDVLLVAEGSSAGPNFKGKEQQLFLFEQIIIFSDMVGKRTQFSNPVYIYKNQLQVNKMALEETTDDGDPLKFILKSKCPHKQGVAFVCQAPTAEVRHQWVSQIESILNHQQNFLLALQSPIAYQKELTKESSAPDSVSAWNPALRKTLSHPSSSSTFLKKQTEAVSDGVKQRRSQRDKKQKASSDAADRRMTVACTTPTCKPTELVTDSLTSNKMSSLPCSPTDGFPDAAAVPDASDVSNDYRKNSLPLEKHVTSCLSVSVAGSHTTTTTLPSPPKSKKHFLDGFRNQRRSKTKADLNLNNGGDSVSRTDSSKAEGGPSASTVRRWSETNTPKPLNATL